MNKVLVTGGTGFVGKHIADVCFAAGYQVCVSGKEYDDLTDMNIAQSIMAISQPDYVIHCAALSGGLTWNKSHSDDIFYQNTLMTLNTMRAAAHHGVKKFVGIISSCAYPDIQGDIKEEQFWDGLPHESIRFFGLQKRNIMAYSMALAKQFPDQTFVNAIINNMYGPYDTFDFNRTKVVGATIRRFIEAKEANAPFVQCLGDGTPTRQFTYVKDAAQGVLQVLYYYNDSNSPINITAMQEVSIKELAETVAQLVEYKGEIRWEGDSGIVAQSRKSMCGEKASKLLNFQAKTSLREGLIHTIAYYMKNREQANIQ